MLHFTWFTAVALQLASAAPADERDAAAVESPLSADESLRHFQLAEGLRLELAAAEPEVVDPVAIRFDELGRMWVVEMRDYPNAPAPGKPPLSQVKLLEDRDGDGRYETARVFADQLLFATGLQPWRGGVIVTYSGRIEWLRDDDGDGRADRRETWFTGFAEENSQLRANHPRFALDHFVYVANGLRGGTIQNVRHAAAEPIAIGGRDFRFDPRALTAQAVSGHGQFGLTFDDFGNRFTCGNRNPLIHVVLADDDLARNPYLAVPAVVQDVAASGDASRVFPISQTWTTSNLHVGQFTAACGVEIYRGDALPDAFQGNAFTCEPTGNLVHRELIEPAGATFVSHPAEEGVEFLASPDRWFRPVNLETGPDGALYVVDMYRAVIEHPDWVPDELKHRPDERYGDDRGRIYRIVPADWRRPASPRLADTATSDLVAELAHANSWRRETAARMLYERQDRAAVAPLEALAGEAADPRARIHALWALHGLDAPGGAASGDASNEREPRGRAGGVSPLLASPLFMAAVERALDDHHPRVREQAVRLAAPRLARSEALRRRVIELADDADARVRFQVALALGQAAGDDAVAPLARIALTGANDVWTRRAVATAVPDRAGRLLEIVTSAEVSNEPTQGSSSDGRLALAGELARLVGARHEPSETAAAIDRLAAGRDRGSAGPARHLEIAILLGLAQGAQSRGASLGAVLADAPASAATAKKLFNSAASWTADAAADPAIRIEACAVLQYADDDVAVPALLDLLKRDESPELRVVAVGALAAHRGERIGGALLDILPHQTPALRGAVLDALLATPDRVKLLLDAIAAGTIKATELDPSRAGRLVRHADAAIGARAAALLAAALPADRAKVLLEYRPALDLPSDAVRGREVFKKNCAGCHRVGGLGVDVAPSISDSRTKTREQLLVDILQPSKAIDAAFVSFTVVTADGRAEVGLIAAETASSISLKQAEGKTITLLRSEIEELRSNGVSLMPDGLERSISRRQMADLISFIKNWRYVEANLPARAGR
ncbi:MAG TPA: PVC-type heme-binding CxxCH protein [Pirellulales bacterium]|nr:PVC-type heme-binding CxxCH protein [Pirellulales bacterium]